MRVFKKWIALILELRNLRLNYAKRMRSVKGTGMCQVFVNNLYYPSSLL